MTTPCSESSITASFGSGNGGSGLGAASGDGGGGTDRPTDLVALPAGGGERLDHAVDCVQLADEVRRVVVAAWRRRAHLRALRRFRFSRLPQLCALPREPGALFSWAWEVFPFIGPSS
jgi:hypothetical protein